MQRLRNTARTALGMGFGVLALFLAVVAPLVQPTSAMSCEPLASTSFCHSVLAYDTVLIVRDDTCQGEQEAGVSSVPNLLAALAAVGAPAACSAGIAAYACATAFPACTASGPVSGPCQSMCQNVVAQCGGSSSPLVQMAQGLGLDLDCTTKPTTTCYTPDETPSIVPAYPSCVKYQTGGGGSFCSDVLGDRSVYIPAGMTFAELEANANALGGLMAYVGSSPGGVVCKQLLKAQVCTNVFLSCDSAVLPAPIPFPKFECLANCAMYDAICVQTGLLPDTALEQLPASARTFMEPNCAYGAGVKIPAEVVCNKTLALAAPDFPAVSTFYPSVGVSVSCVNDLPDFNYYYVPPTPVEPLASTSFCATILPPEYARGVNVFGTCQDVQEVQLAAAPQLMSALQHPDAGLPAECAFSVARFSCVGAFPNALGLPPCRSLCEAVHTNCYDPQGVVVGLLSNFITPLKDCTKLPTTGCYADRPPMAVATEKPFTPKIRSPPKCIESYTAAGGQLCADIVTYPFYLPAEMTFEALEGTAAQLQFLYNFIPWNEQGAQCNQQFTRQLCMSLFLGCDDGVIARINPAVFGKVHLPFPRFVSREVCEEYNAACAVPPAILAQLPLQAQQFFAPNCTGSGIKFPATSLCGQEVAPGLEDYPVSSTVFPIAIQGFPPLATQAVSANANAVQVYSRCPYPLVAPVHPGDAIAGTGCALPCPMPFYNAEEYDALDKMNIVFTVLSFLCNGFLLTTWTLFEAKRRQVYVHMFLISVFLQSLAMLIGIFTTEGRSSRVGCTTESTPSSQTSSQEYCPWQSAFIQLFAQAAAIWWCIISIDLFLIVVMGMKKNYSPRIHRIKTIAYFSAGLGIPIFDVIVVAALKAMGPVETLSWCFITSRPIYSSYAFFWAPIILCMIVGITCIGSLMWHLWSSSRLTGLNKASGSWKQYVRPILFLIAFLIDFGYAVIFQLVSETRQSQFKDSMTRYVTCLLGPGGSVALCGDHADQRLDEGAWRMMHFALGGQGIVCVCIWGTLPDNWTLWKGWFQNLRQGKPQPKGGRRSYAGETSQIDSDHHSRTAATHLSKAGDDDGVGANTGATANTPRRGPGGVQPVSINGSGRDTATSTTQRSGGVAARQRVTLAGPSTTKTSNGNGPAAASSATNPASPSGRKQPSKSVGGASDGSAGDTNGNLELTARPVRPLSPILSSPIGSAVASSSSPAATTADAEDVEVIIEAKREAPLVIPDADGASKVKVGRPAPLHAPGAARTISGSSANATNKRNSASSPAGAPALVRGESTQALASGVTSSDEAAEESSRASGVGASPLPSPSLGASTHRQSIAAPSPQASPQRRASAAELPPADETLLSPSQVAAPPPTEDSPPLPASNDDEQ